MRIQMTTTLLLVFCLVAMPTNATSGAREKVGAKGESFGALAQLPVAGTTLNVRIHIDGYSTPQDAQRLHALLLEGGSRALLKALQKMKSIGRIEREGTVGFYTLKLILSTPTPTGRHIYAITDRPIGFLEAYLNTRSRDYPFGILELDLQENNEKEKGEGTLIYAAKIKTLHGDKVEIENVAFAPIKLLGVRRL